MDITVVAPTYQRADLLPRLVAALEAQTYPADRFEVLLVDDCSDDDTPRVLAELVAASPLRLRALRTDRNGGPALARNLAWRAADTELVAFTDDDCVPDPGWIAAMVAAFEDAEDVGVVQGRTEAPDGEREQWSLSREIGGPTPWFEGCNIAFRREALDATGGYDEIIRWYGEDTAAGWRVVDGGWRRAFAPAAVVVHDLEVRGPRYRIRHAWLEGNLVALAARHPGLRDGFWRRWAFRHESVSFLVAVAGVLGAIVRWPLVLLVLPYAWTHRWAIRSPRTIPAIVAIDAAAVAGHARGSLAGRIVVL